MKANAYCYTPLFLITLLELIFCNGAFGRTLIEVEHLAKGGCKVVIYENATLSEQDREFDALTWSGRCKKGYVDGAGTVFAKRKGIEITGTANFVHGRPEGEGTYEAVSGNGDREVFKGQFVNGLQKGDGQQTITKSGQTIIYTGGFLAGLPHGNGKLESGGTTYIGEFVEGRLQGVATITFPNKAIYTGETRDGKMNGIGKLIFPDGIVVSANFLPDRLPTLGQVKNSKGFTYDGELDKLRPSGRGKLTSPDGSVYTGDFRNGKPNGTGIVEMANGQRVEVVATEGKMQRRTTQEQPKPVQKVEQKEDDGLDWLHILGAIGKGLQDADEANRRRQDAEVLNKHHAPGIYKGESRSGMNKLCYYDDMGSARVITIGATDLCPI